MTSIISGQPAPWLVIDASHADQLRFASVRPAPRPVVSNVVSIPIDGMPTFTDALQRYERESGLPLRGRECVIGMAGAVNGETLSLVRSRWTITRGGLAAVFGRPVSVLNDVAATAWAARSGTMRADSVRGFGQPLTDRAGRMVMLLVEDGVGACAIDITAEGRTRILETECGHMDFAPASEVEQRLATAARGLMPFASWERMLTLDADDPAWRAACPELVLVERHRLLAGLLGRFAVNLIHAFGAWQGVMITGSRAARLMGSENRVAFGVPFTAKRNFARLVGSTPVWRTELREPVLTGGAELLAHGFGAGPASVAA